MISKDLACDRCKKPLLESIWIGDSLVSLLPDYDDSNSIDLVE